MIHIIFSVFVSIHSLSKITYATIGNEAYIAGYLIFNMYFSILLFYRERTSGIKWLYLAPLPFLFYTMMTITISGAWVGIGLSIVLALFLYGVLAPNKKIKIATILGFVLATSLILNFFVFNRDNFLTQRVPFFDSMTQEINFGKRTFQTRLISWRAALKDFSSHPIFGTGHGNYAITFDKHFDPKFYNFTRGETYFDRAHNNVVDIASTSGSLGLITYLAIYVAIGFYLIRGYLKKYIGLHEFVIISALLTAYFVQNLAVFDSLVTYMASMIVFGYILWLVREGEESLLEEVKEKATKVKRRFTKDKGYTSGEIYALVFAGAVILTIMYQYNIKPWNMLVATIDGQRAWASGNVAATFDKYEEAFALNTVLDRDSRTSLVRLFAGGGSGRLKQLGPEKGAEALDWLIGQARKNVAYNENDSLNQMLLAQILITAANFHAQDAEKNAFYSDQAVEAIDASVAASPGRVPIYYQKAQIHINRGEEEKAIESLKKAISLNENYESSYCHLGRTLLYYNREEEAYENMDICLEKKGANQIAPAGQVKGLINHYVDEKNWKFVILLYERLTKLEPKKTENWTRLAQIHAQLGEREKAREAAQKAIEIDPSIADYAEDFIKQLGL
jgi:O-antigen ligase/tetratricopeptide (TPR) repeat protein